MGGWRRWAIVAAGTMCLLPAGGGLEGQDRPRFSVGIEAGPSLSKFSGPTIKAPGHVAGVFAGVFGEYRVNPLFSVPFGINYVQKGGKGRTLADDPFEISTAYLEIPVMLNLTAPESAAGSFGVYAGLSAGFRLRCDVESSSGKSECGDTEIFDTNPEDMEWAVPFGIEYDRELSGGHLIGVDVRYTYGLNDLFTADDAELKSRTWQFLLSWAFPVVR